MDQTVRARALAIEMDARQYPPADALNRLAVRCAQLEAQVASQQRYGMELVREIEQLRAHALAGGKFAYDGSFEPVNTLLVDGVTSTGPFDVIVTDGPVG